MKGTNPRVMIAGVLAAFFVGFIVTFALPMTDPALSRVTEYTVPYSKEILRGKTTYDMEGCVFCHTQQVRPVKADVGLGLASEADRYAHDERSVIGMARIGPDLACVGDRFEGAAALSAYLQNPRLSRPYSTMPSLRYLSAEELDDLSAYLAGLTCSGS